MQYQCRCKKVPAVIALTVDQFVSTCARSDELAKQPIAEVARPDT